jgi:hypothetical protein
MSFVQGSCTYLIPITEHHIGFGGHVPGILVERLNDHTNQNTPFFHAKFCPVTPERVGGIKSLDETKKPTPSESHFAFLPTEVIDLIVFGLCEPPQKFSTQEYYFLVTSVEGRKLIMNRVCRLFLYMKVCKDWQEKSKNMIKSFADKNLVGYVVNFENPITSENRTMWWTAKLPPMVFSPRNFCWTLPNEDYFKKYNRIAVFNLF